MVLVFSVLRNGRQLVYAQQCRVRLQCYSVAVLRTDALVLNSLWNCSQQGILKSTC